MKRDGLATRPYRFTDLAKLMRKHDIGAIPIGENDRLICMVTDRDIVCKGLAEDSFDSNRATARDVMTQASIASRGR
jgi:predicted transcriptional regulator